MPPTAPTPRLCATCSSIVGHTELKVSEIYDSLPIGFRAKNALQAFRDYKSYLGFRDEFAKERLESLFRNKSFRNSPFTSTSGTNPRDNAEALRRNNNRIDNMVIESIFDSLKDYTVTKMLTLDYMDKNAGVIHYAAVIMGFLGSSEHKDISQYIETEFEKASQNMQNQLTEIKDHDARQKAVERMINDKDAREKAREMIKRVADKAQHMQSVKIKAALLAEQKAANHHEAENKQDSKSKKGVKIRGRGRKRGKSRTREEHHREKTHMRRKAWGPTPPPEKTYNSNKPLSEARKKTQIDNPIRRSQSTNAKFYDNDKTNF